jgi:hypothetical protein
MVRTNMSSLVGGRFPHSIQTGLVSFMISVRKVEACDSESSIDQLLELRNVPARGAQRAHDLALAFLSLGLGHDLFERNVGAAEFRAGSSHFGLREGHGTVCTVGLLIERERGERMLNRKIVRNVCIGK